MAGLGFKDFQVGEVLTSSDVDGYLMQQTVMRFADSGARGSALGTASGTAVALAEGMVSYLDDSNAVEFYTGATWVPVGKFTALTVITATDASWSVPTLAHPLVRVTVIGGGGGGGGGGIGGGAGSDGTGSSFVASGINVTAAGGTGGGARVTSGIAGQQAPGAQNGGQPGKQGGDGGGNTGNGGRITVAYVDLSSISTVNVTVGAGGAGGTGGAQTGGVGGAGAVIVEYQAG